MGALEVNLVVCPLIYSLDGEYYINSIYNILAWFEYFIPLTEKELDCHLDLVAFACRRGNTFI